MSQSALGTTLHSFEESLLVEVPRLPAVEVLCAAFPAAFTLKPRPVLNVYVCRAKDR